MSEQASYRPVQSDAPARMIGTIAHVSHSRAELGALVYAALTKSDAPAEQGGERPFGLSPLEVAKVKASLLQAMGDAFSAGFVADYEFDASAKADAILAALQAAPAEIDLCPTCGHLPPADPVAGVGEAEKLLVRLLDTLAPFSEVADKFRGCSVVEISKPHPDNPSPTIMPMPREWFERAANDLEAAAVLLHGRGVLSEGQASKITGLDRVSIRKQVDDLAGALERARDVLDRHNLYDYADEIEEALAQAKGSV